MSVDRDNVIQAFGWFKDLMNADIDAQLAGLSTAINSLEVGDKNVIESISVDGTLQPVTNKTAALNMSAYAKKTDVANALSSISSLSLAINSLKVGDTNVIEAIAVDGTAVQPDASKTVNLNLGLNSFAKKTDVASGVRMKGSVDFFSDLANLSETPAVGDLYNIKSAGGTDGDGTPILAGDNVVYTDKGTWDVMAGFVDTSIFVEKVAGKQLSTNDFTNADKAKLDSLSNATPYTLPAATTTERGGIRPGIGLEMRKNVGGNGYTDILDCTFGNDFAIASATTDGMSGLVPKPYAGDQDFYLKAGSGWAPLPTATKDQKGCVRVGGGLSMSGETLYVTLESGDTYNDFTGATSIVGGTSGLVPAPVAGQQGLFLRGDGSWAKANNITVISGDATVGPDPTEKDGVLWRDTVEGYPVLKLRYGDYEFNFNYDTSTWTGTTPPPQVVGDPQLYALDTVASTDEGTLWYNLSSGSIHMEPALVLHTGAFDYGFNYDTITYKGGKPGLVAYLPLQSTIEDAMGNITTSVATPVIEQFTINGATYRGLRNVSPDITGTSVSTKDVCQLPLNNALSVYTIDCWFTVLPTNTLGSQYVLHTPRKSIRFTSEQKLLCGNTTLATGAGRYHIAMVNSTSGFKVYLNGQQVISEVATSEIEVVNLFHGSANYATTNAGAQLYFDHLCVWNKVVWDKNFTPPTTLDNYI